jgi:hypothetical protein
VRHERCGFDEVKNFVHFPVDFRICRQRLVGGKLLCFDVLDDLIIKANAMNESVILETNIQISQVPQKYLIDLVVNFGIH